MLPRQRLQMSFVINPSHKLTHSYPKEDIARNRESLMRIYNKTMTVQQLIDPVSDIKINPAMAF